MASPTTSNLQKRSLTVLGLALLFIFWFGALEYRDLFNPDEGRYAEIPREMLASGDWITPRLNDLKYFEKPALQYWITAAAYFTLGIDEWTARLWPAMAGFLTLILVYFMGRRLAGVHAGVAATATLASTFQFFLFSQVLTLDMGLTFFLTLALGAFLASHDTRCNAAQRRNWTILTWAAMALAVLSKGLVGVVLPGLVLLAYFILERDRKILRCLLSAPGILVFLGIVLPWFIWVQVRNPEFFRFFFVHEHFARYASGQHQRPGAWYYFLVVLLLGSAPWTFAYLRALLTSWQATSINPFEIKPGRLLVLWAVVITLFYSLSASKLPGYILPVYPALALLLGAQAGKFHLSSRYLVGIGAIGAAIAIAAPFVIRIPKFAADPDLIVPYVPWMAAGGLTLMAAALMGGTLLRKGRWYGLPVIAFGSLIAFQLLVTGTQSVAVQFSSEDLVERAQEKIGDFAPDVPFYSVGMYDQTLPLHLGRTLTIVNYRNELAMGISQEPERAISTMEEFRQRWLAEPQAYAIISPQRFAEEQSAGTPMVVLAGNRKAFLVARERQAKLGKGPSKPTM